MQKALSTKHPNGLADEINLQELFYVLLKDKWVIVSVTAFVSIIGVIYSLLLPNIYESKAILVPVKTSNSISSNLGGYSSIAGFAGVRLPSINDGNAGKAIKKIGSLSFFEKNILPNIHLPDLMAVKYWNSKTNTFVYNEKIYDSNSNTWIRDDSNIEQKIPSAQRSFAIFRPKLSIDVDVITSFVTISINHQSPFVAKQWTELVVNEVNNFYRQKDRLESEKAASYLNQQILITSLSEVKEALVQLLQEETKKLTLIEANNFYVFEYIDPPAVMETKSGPNRSLICILITLFGGFLSVLLVLIRHYFLSKKAS